MLAAIARGQTRDRLSSARRKAHIASVIVSVRITSGIRMRVNRNSPTQVASTRPA